MKSMIVLLGPPGAGKGTQGERMETGLGYIRLSTGDTLREAVRNGTELGKLAKGYMDRGDLVPNDVIINLMKEKIESLGKVPGIIFDGFPRTVEQAEALDKELNIDCALNFDVEDKVLIDRLTQRRSCLKCNAVYHLTNNPPKKAGLCDRCGSELYQRDDDKEATVKNRLSTYREKTFPLIGYYEKAGKLVTIKGTGDIETIFANVKKVI